MCALMHEKSNDIFITLHGIEPDLFWASIMSATHSSPSLTSPPHPSLPSLAITRFLTLAQPMGSVRSPSQTSNTIFPSALIEAPALFGERDLG